MISHIKQLHFVYNCGLKKTVALNKIHSFFWIFCYVTQQKLLRPHAFMLSHSFYKLQIQKCIGVG